MFKSYCLLFAYADILPDIVFTENIMLNHCRLRRNVSPHYFHNHAEQMPFVPKFFPTVPSKTAVYAEFLSGVAFLDIVLRT